MAEIIGAIAVVVSVIYLGVQIKENTKILRTQAHYNALSLAQRPFEMVVQNDNLAQLINTCYSKPGDVMDDEWVRCRYYFVMEFNAWEYLFYQNRDGSIPPQLWSGADAYYKSLISNKAGVARLR